MRIRSIVPKFYESEDVGRMSWETRLLFIGLWSYVDDNGVGRDVPALIAADLFPYDLARDSDPRDTLANDSRDPRDTLARVADGLQTLSEGGQIVRYTIDGRALLFVARWDDYQKIDRPAKDRYPRPTTGNADPRDTLATPSRMIRDTLATGEGEKGRRGEGEKRERGARKRGARLDPAFIPSEKSRSTILSECPHLDVAREHAKFVDYFTAAPGQKGVKLDWDATWRGWMRRAIEGGRSHTGGTSRRQQETDDLFAAAYARAQAADLAEGAMP